MKPVNYDYQLILGNGMDVLKSLPDKSIDLILTDPPYGVGIEYSSIFNDNIEYVKSFMPDLINHGCRVAKRLLFTVGTFEIEKWLYQNFPPRWRLCWYKGAQSTASPVGFSDWEMVMVYGDDVMTRTHDYLQVAPSDNNPYIKHPCPKSLKWATWLISRFSKPGDWVMDPFLGSGTSGVAAWQLKRKFVGVEIEPRFYMAASERIALAKSQLHLPLGL